VRVLSTEDQQRPGYSVSEIMARDVPVVSANKSVKDAAVLMEKKDYGCLIVLDQDIAVGIVTEKDVVLKVTAEGIDPSKVLVEDVMSSPLVSVPSDASIGDAAVKMNTFKVRKLVVTDDAGRLVGLVTSIDLARWLSAQKNYADQALNAIAKMGPPIKDGPYE
jgi:CBS domain-containing protein